MKRRRFTIAQTFKWKDRYCNFEGSRLHISRRNEPHIWDILLRLDDEEEAKTAGGWIDLSSTIANILVGKKCMVINTLLGPAILRGNDWTDWFLIYHSRLTIAGQVLEIEGIGETRRMFGIKDKP